MNEQALGLRSVGHSPKLRCPLVVVSGGKGGVGKTTLAANLGLALQQRELKVLLVDLDLGLANLNVLLGLEIEHHLEDFLDGTLALDDCLVHHPLGFDVLPAGSGSADMARPDSNRRARILEALEQLSVHYDVLVADTAAGIGSDVLAFCALADYCLAVTTPEPAAITDAYGLLKALDAYASERAISVPTPELVVNRAENPEQADAVAARIQKVSMQFLSRAPRLAGWIARSKEVEAATAEQRLFLEQRPESFAGRAVTRLAKRIERLFEHVWSRCKLYTAVDRLGDRIALESVAPKSTALKSAVYKARTPHCVD